MENPVILSAVRRATLSEHARVNLQQSIAVA